MEEKNYGVEQIRKLSQREAVRERPGMYIGSTSQAGINQLVFEIADNSVDEAVAGYCTHINVHVDKTGVVTVVDNGRGIPVGEAYIDEEGNKTWVLTEILTTLHMGGKFKKDTSAYGGVSSGLHGVGSSCVCFLSEWLEVTVKRDNHIYWQRFERGEPVTELEIKGDTTETGTTISYYPDNEIFQQTLLPNENVKNRLNELALLNAGLTINYINDYDNKEYTFYYEEGIIGYIKQMTKDKPLLYDEVISFAEDYVDEKQRPFHIEIAFAHDDAIEPTSKLKSFANNINTYEGGYHLTGFKNAYKEVFNQYGLNNALLKEPIEMQYLMDGLYAVINIKLQSAEFEGQTKTKLGNAEAKDAVEKVLIEHITKRLSEKSFKAIAEVILNRAIKTKEAELQARKARDIARTTKKVLKMSMPGKLADCSNKKGYRELILVEGKKVYRVVALFKFLELLENYLIIVNQQLSNMRKK